jgi:hypothetical protein
MKNILVILTVMALLVSCKKTDDSEKNQNTSISATLLPEKVVVDIPSAISSDQVQTKSGTNGDTLKGGDIYNHLRTFINVGEKSAELIGEIISAIRSYGLNNAMEFTFTSKEDGRQKKCVIVEGITYNDKKYQYKLTITDSSEYAMQVLWNTKPVEGIAILNPYNINRNELKTGALYMLEYGDSTLATYDKFMVVSIMNWPVIGVYGLNNLKLFVGKKGDKVEIYGNSNHPKAVFFDISKTDGVSYSFTARADQTNDIAVVNLALPGTSITTVDRIFEDFSITKVFETEMHTVWDPFAGGNPILLLYIDNTIDRLLVNAQIPGYFNQSGFIGCGTNIPQGFSNEFVNLSGLKPYIPNDIKNLKIEFVK